MIDAEKLVIDLLAEEYLKLEKYRIENDIDFNDVVKKMIEKLEEWKKE